MQQTPRRRPRRRLRPQHEHQPCPRSTNTLSPLGQQLQQPQHQARPRQPQKQHRHPHRKTCLGLTRKKLQRRWSAETSEATILFAACLYVTIWFLCSTFVGTLFRDSRQRSLRSHDQCVATLFLREDRSISSVLQLSCMSSVPAATCAGHVRSGRCFPKFCSKHFTLFRRTKKEADQIATGIPACFRFERESRFTQAQGSGRLREIRLCGGVSSSLTGGCWKELVHSR